eukprot:m.96037 g.96037  ORF g.96037 m.96037 type:complete len:52 (+) comp21959_c1_seq1:1136-1291(+)
MSTSKNQRNNFIGEAVVHLVELFSLYWCQKQEKTQLGPDHFLFLPTTDELI